MAEVDKPRSWMLPIDPESGAPLLDVKYATDGPWGEAWAQFGDPTAEDAPPAYAEAPADTATAAPAAAPPAAPVAPVTPPGPPPV